MARTVLFPPVPLRMEHQSPRRVLATDNPLPPKDPIIMQSHSVTMADRVAQLQREGLNLEEATSQAFREVDEAKRLVRVASPPRETAPDTGVSMRDRVEDYQRRGLSLSVATSKAFSDAALRTLPKQGRYDALLQEIGGVSAALDSYVAAVKAERPNGNPHENMTEAVGRWLDKLASLKAELSKLAPSGQVV